MQVPAHSFKKGQDNKTLLNKKMQIVTTTEVADAFNMLMLTLSPECTQWL